MYTQLAEIPTPLSATFFSEDVVQVTYSSRNHLSNTKKTLTKIVPLEARASISLPIQDIGDIVAQTISPSFKLRATLRETKQGTSTKRFVEIWSGNRIDVSFEVTDYHESFYLDEYLTTLIFSPSETALLYTAEANGPSNTSDDPYAKFRFKPSFGEGFGGKKRPHFFLLRWNLPTDSPPSLTPKLYEIQPKNHDVLFGQGAFCSTPDEDTIYATGYEYMQNGRLLGIKGCFNRPFGIWQLQFQAKSDDNDDQDEKKSDLIIHSARKISDTNSARCPRVLCDGPRSTLYWLSSNSGGPHVSTAILQSLDITSLDDVPSDVTANIGTVVDIPKTDEPGFPGLYPPFNLPPRPFLQNGTRLVTQSQWGSRTTIISICLSAGVVEDLTPPDADLSSWNLLGTDGKNRIICSKSSPAVPYEILLGVLSNGGQQWSTIDQPDLAPDVQSALRTIHTSIHPIPSRSPTETIVVQSRPSDEIKPRPLVTVPHGGPHAATTTAFTPANTALVLEGYTLSLPNYTGTTGYGQAAIYKLLGQCGKLDVEDVHASTLYVVNDLKLAQPGKGRIFVMGGSHGGFITAHLISRYPDIYSAAILRNPVITCGEVSGTDIPDWYFAEFGFQDNFPLHSSQPSDNPSSASISRTHFEVAPYLTPNVFEELYKASPSTALVNYLKTRPQSSEQSGQLPPVLLLIGGSDQRVSPTQGTGFYHLLKGAGEEVEMLIFDGEGHPLEGVEAAKVGWEAARDWLKRFRKED